MFKFFEMKGKIFLAREIFKRIINVYEPSHELEKHESYQNPLWIKVEFFSWRFEHNFLKILCK